MKMEPLTVPGTLDSLDTIRKFVAEAATKAGLEKKRAYALRLAVDEIATNIVTHSYQEAGCTGNIFVQADMDEQALTITLEDNGTAFDPTTRRPPTEEEFTQSIEERDIGGWGVYLAIHNVDEFIYLRMGEGNRNVFIMHRTTQGNLLIVDATHAIRDTLSRYLKADGYTVTIAEGGPQALEMMRVQKFDLALWALDAPNLSALQALPQLKADNALRSIPILILCTPNDLTRAEQCIETGADDYLVEPFSPIVVKARVRANLGKRRIHLAEESLRESAKYARDVQIGRQIQLGFLPDELPQPPGYEIVSHFEPAREVAGDFYDAFVLPSHKVGMVLGDVCDKGVGAALFMALFRSMIRAFAQQTYPASATMDVSTEERRLLLKGGNMALKMTMERTNEYIATTHRESNMFATIFFGMLEPQTGEIYYVNGGHEPPIIFSPNGIKSRLKSSGPAVGMMPQMKYHVQQAILEPGDTLLIYSDGVTEAKNPQGKFFTEKRLLSLLEQPSSSAKELLGHIETALREHIDTAAQFDDITMLAVRRAPADQK